MNEAKITINGHPLNVGQSMALRVAVTSYHAEMSEPNALDADSEPLRLAYLDRLNEVLHLIINGIEGAKT